MDEEDRLDNLELLEEINRYLKSRNLPELPLKEEFDKRNIILIVHKWTGKHFLDA